MKNVDTRLFQVRQSPRKPAQCWVIGTLKCARVYLRRENMLVITVLDCCQVVHCYLPVLTFCFKCCCKKKVLSSTLYLWVSSSSLYSGDLSVGSDVKFCRHRMIFLQPLRGLHLYCIMIIVSLTTNLCPKVRSPVWAVGAQTTQKFILPSGRPVDGT